jgi:hypothetical protein
MTNKTLADLDIALARSKGRLSGMFIRTILLLKNNMSKMSTPNDVLKRLRF